MGGAAGHMMHPFQCPDVKTGNDLLALFEEAKNKVGSVKLDGTNVSFKLINTPAGGKEFAGDRGSFNPLDVQGLTSTKIGDRFEEGHGMREMYGLVVNILNDTLNTKDPRTGESIIKQELEALGMWDNSAIFINTEYVKGKTNVVEYPVESRFLAFHGINHFYERIPARESDTKMARTRETGHLPMPEKFLDMPRSKRPASAPIQFARDAMQSLVNKINPFAQKYDFSIVHNFPTEHELNVNLDNLYDNSLNQQVLINLAGKNSAERVSPLKYNIKEWLNLVSNPIDESGGLIQVRLANGRGITALSKYVYQELINNQTPVDELLAEDASKEEGKMAVDGAIIYYATMLLGKDILRSQRAAGELAQKLFGKKLMNLSKHEGLVILDEDESPFCGGAQVKFTGEFIETGQTSDFRQVNESMLNEQNEQGQYVVMIPGGFKPPTAGHYQMINQYAQHPSVKEVIIIQGPKDRDGVTNAESKAIFELYGGFPNNVKYMISRHFENEEDLEKEEKTPMHTAYNLVTEESFTSQFGPNTIFSIGSSSKGGDDKRTENFVAWFHDGKGKGSLPKNVQVSAPPFIADVFSRDGTELSASTMRNALAEGDLEMVKLHLPDESFLNAVLQILDYDISQKKTMEETLSLTDLFSLVESVMDEKRKKKRKKKSRREKFVKDDRVPLTVSADGKPELDIRYQKTKKRNPKEELVEQPGAEAPPQEPGIPIVDAAQGLEQAFEQGGLPMAMEFLQGANPALSPGVEGVRDLMNTNPEVIQKALQKAVDQPEIKQVLTKLNILVRQGITPNVRPMEENEDLDEASSMAGGSVEGAAGNVDEDRPNGLIREEDDIIERIIHKLSAGEF